MALADVEQDRLHALGLDGLTMGEAASRSSARRARSRRRGPRQRRRCGRSGRTSAPVYVAGGLVVAVAGTLGAEDLASAATPTSSCSGGGLLVARRRWISRPGVWKASASVARGCGRSRRRAQRRSRPRRARPPARASGPGLLDRRSSRTCRRPRGASSARSGWSRSDRAPWAPRPDRRAPAHRRRSPCARPRGRRRGRDRSGRRRAGSTPTPG